MDKNKSDPSQKKGSTGNQSKSGLKQQQNSQSSQGSKKSKGNNNSKTSNRGGGGSSKGNNNNDDENKAKIPFQAVVLADSFTRTLRPVSIEVPKVLIPLANVPLLEYTIEFLAASGVEEIIVFCCWRAGDIEKYIENSRWAHSTNPIVRTVSYRKVTNAGDAIRQLESLGIIKSDPFILMSGDVIANINLVPAIQAHKLRREKDKECAMTMIFRGNGGASLPRTASIEDDLVIALNPATGQILRYENDSSQNTLIISQAKELFKTKGPSIEVRYDLCDCFIDICSPDVISQISDNYDYQDLRKDYVRLETQNHELGLKFYAHIYSSSNEYAARVHDIRTYDAISRDVLHRWTYPRVPDTNWSSLPSTYTMTHGFVYREMGVSVARSATISESSMIGTNTKLGPNSKIERCIIGRNCIIGEGVHISDSYLWDDVIIEKGSKVEKALICNRVHVKENSIIERGVVLSFNVVVGEGVHIKPFSRITTVEKSKKIEKEWIEDEENDEFDDDFDENNENNDLKEDSEEDNNSNDNDNNNNNESLQIAYDSEIIGVKGIGREYHQEDEDSQFNVESDDEYGGAPKWMHSTIDFYRKHHNPPILESYATLRSAMAAIELENARSKLWSIEKKEKIATHQIKSEKNSQEKMVKPSTVATKSESTPKLQAISANSSSMLIIGDNNVVEDEDDGFESNKEIDLANERFVKGIREFIEAGRGGVELLGFKLSEHRSNSDMVYVLLPILLERCQGLSTANQIVKEAKEVLKNNQTMLKSYISDSQVEHALVESLELFCLYGQRAPFIALNPLLDRENEHVTGSQALKLSFPLILSSLITDELVSSDGLSAWKNQHEEDEVINQELFNNQITKDVINAILDDDDDDDEGEDEEDEDD